MVRFARTGVIILLIALATTFNPQGGIAGMASKLGVSSAYFDTFNNALVNAGGPAVDGIRMYKGNADITQYNDVTNRLAEGDTVWASITRTDSSFLNAFKTKFDNYGRTGTNQLKVIYWHEPENDSTMTPTKFTNNFIIVSNALKPKFEMVTTMMAWTYRDSHRAAWLDAGWPGKQYVDWFTIDVYQSSVPYVSWTTLIDAARQFAVNQGVANLGIMEWGSLRGGPQSDGIHQMGDYLYGHTRFKAAIYWDSTAKFNYIIHDEPLAMAAFADIERQLG